jgi:ribosomal protein S18 acetylase RimI-like enzyme
VAGYEIGPVRDNLDAVAALYAAAGFRPDLIDDLRFLQRLGGQVFVARHAATIAGASSCLPFAATGWIGGVAVAPQHRGRGLGTELTEAALHDLKARGVSTALLHATEMARPLYERMGFTPVAELVELSGDPRPGMASAGTGTRLRAGTGADLAAVLALDRQATGEDRGRLLRELWPQGGWVCAEADRVRGFLLAQGPSAVGTVIAEPDVGLDLLAAALSAKATAPGGRLRVPLPVSQEAARGLLAKLGFREAFRTTRMHLGPHPAWHAERIFSVFNLYWG